MNDKKASFQREVWDNLSSINVNNHVQKKMGLSYLSWSWAWATLMEEYPESTYQFRTEKEDNGTAEIWVVLTIIKDGNRFDREMWLPVMDYKNKSVINPSTRDINDARMRCLTKAMAMVGLGHYIYAGEDIPREDVKAEEKPSIGEEAKKLKAEGEEIKTTDQLTEWKDKLSEAKEAKIIQGNEIGMLSALYKTIERRVA